MRQSILTLAALAAMLTIGKFSTDAGYIVNLASLVIGGIVGAVAFTMIDRHARKRNAG